MARKPKRSPLSFKSGWLSLWAGHFDSLDQLEAHVDSGDFETQQGFTIEPPLLPFNAFLDDGSAEALVRLLLKDDRLVRKVVDAIDEENCNALMLHDGFTYDVTLAPRGKKRMRFLGSWRSPKRR